MNDSKLWSTNIINTSQRLKTVNSRLLSSHLLCARNAQVLLMLTLKETQPTVVPALKYSDNELHGILCNNA